MIRKSTQVKQFGTRKLKRKDAFTSVASGLALKADEIFE
jgi:hypothetical protein